jgi:hypothetical protein
MDTTRLKQLRQQAIDKGMTLLDLDGISAYRKGNMITQQIKKIQYLIDKGGKVYVAMPDGSVATIDEHGRVVWIGADKSSVKEEIKTL